MNSVRVRARRNNIDEEGLSSAHISTNDSEQQQERLQNMDAVLV
jgi:hypothetical protein